MAIVEQTKQGISYIRVGQKEMMVHLRGFGICDSCSKQIKQSDTGYLIPVLNSVYCESCFNDWSKRAKYYEEDAKYETQKIKDYLSALQDNI